MSITKILGISDSPLKGQNCEKMIGSALEFAKERDFETDRVLLSTRKLAPVKPAELAEKKINGRQGKNHSVHS